jgi:hypothetical protein
MGSVPVRGWLVTDSETMVAWPSFRSTHGSDGSVARIRQLDLGW